MYRLGPSRSGCSALRLKRAAAGGNLMRNSRTSDVVCGGVWRWCPCASDKPLRATFASSEWQVFMLQGNGKFSKGCNKSAGRPYWGPYNGDSGCDRHEAGFGIEGSRPEHRGPKLNMTRFAFGNHIQVRIQCMCSLTGASCAQLNLDIYTCVWLVVDWTGGQEHGIPGNGACPLTGGST